MKEDAPTDKRAGVYLRHAQVAAALATALCAGIFVAIVALSREDRHPQPGQAVFDFVAHLPTSGWLYLVIGLIALLGLASYWYRLEKTKSDFATLCVDDQNAGAEGDREILVVRELRLRALALRTRAVLFLGSSIMLLLGGVYVTIWVVPIVSSYDAREQFRALLQFKFGDALDALRRGEYWLHALDVKDSRPSLHVSHDGKGGKEFVVDAGDHVLVSTDGLDWEQRDETTKHSAAGTSTRQRADPRFGRGRRETTEPQERTDVRDFNGFPPDVSAGSLGVLELTEFAAYFREVGNERWNRVELNRWSGGDGILKVVEFDSVGTHGLIGTSDGAVYVTDDGGANWETWTGRDIGLNGAEWAVEAAIGSNGPQVIMGDEGTVRVWDGDRWVAPRGAADWESVTVFEFGAKGLHGLVGTRDGAVHVTDDGGANWETWTGRDIGLNGTEWVVEAAIGSDGPQIVMGAEGTVCVWDGDGWVTPRGTDKWRLVTVFEFGTRGLHGLVGTIDGAAHVTDDGGANWETWTGRDVGLNGTEWAVEAAIGSNGPQFIKGDEGTVRVWDGDRWVAPRGTIDWESVTVFEFGANGLRGLVGTRDGSVYATADSENWTLQENLTSAESWTWAPAFVGDGRFVVLRTGPVVYTTDNGTEWSRSEELTKATPLGIEGLYSYGDHAVLSTTSGIAWLKGEGGWSQLRTGFDSEESIAAIAVDEEELIVIGSKGATFMGGQFDPGRGDFEPEQENVVAAEAISGSLVALFEGESGSSIYVRRELTDELVDDDPQALLDSLPDRGKLRRDLAAELVGLDKAVDSRPRRLEDATLIERLGVGQKHWLRAVATLATIYLVQLFVGLYRYSIRLAAHWDSRADAVLLGRSFSGAKPPFDDLIAALGPDALDFKPPRYPYFHSWRRRSRPEE